MTLELCTDSFNGAQWASKYDLKRIELCSALGDGGLTPSFGLINQCATIQTIEVHIMIRPRAGDFNYSADELILMRSEIIAGKKAGAHGVVFGILNEDFTISDKNYELIKVAQDLEMETTFHRAFDLTVDAEKSIKKIIDFKFDRLLTSGQQDEAIKGLDLIKQLQLGYGDKIQIMAGSGINSDNALEFQKSQIKNIHFTARKPMSDKLPLDMGMNYVTDPEKIKRISSLFI